MAKCVLRLEDDPSTGFVAVEVEITGADDTNACHLMHELTNFLDARATNMAGDKMPQAQAPQIILPAHGIRRGH